MNRNCHRLVFSALHGRLVPVCEGTRGRRKGGGAVRGATLAACLLMAVEAVSAAGTLPGGTLPKPLGGVLSPNDGGRASVSGNTMTVNQILPKAIFNWQQFNVSKDATVRFVQPAKTSVALNRIFDANPTVIQGRIDANGQVYLINSNGILFDRGAQINVGGLVASALDIGDQTFLDGFANITDGSPAFAFTGDATAFERSLVRVENGASIKTSSGGSVFMFAKKVENAGRIETPQGQTMLAAGAKVYLAASDDPLLRGFLVEVDPFLKRNPARDPAEKPLGFDSVPDSVVTNERSAEGQGEIIADRGNVTLIGHAVNQNGRVSATTSVNANGSVYLIARESTGTQARPDGSIRRFATITGTVTLGSGSVTEILPVSGGAASGASETSVDSQGFNPSQVLAYGEKILMKSGSLIHAPAGNVSLLAREAGDPSLAGIIPAKSTRSRIVLADDSTIDVSGLENVELAMERNTVSAGLFGVELADSPLQRSGVLSRKTVKFDLRKGLPTIANVQGAVDGIARGIDERSTVGGTVNVSSDGALVVREGAIVDVSGGSLHYRDGYVESTMLISDGRAFDISTASADRIYSSIATAKRFEAGYVEGRSAGTVNLFARGMAVDGTLLGGTLTGPLQRNGGATGGKLVIGNSASLGSTPDFVVSDVVLADGFGSLHAGFDAFPLTSSLGDRLTVTRLSTQPLKSGGFGSLAVYANDSITIPETIDLSLAPRTTVELTAHEVDVAGNIRSAGGTVALTGQATIEHATPGKASIEVRSGTQIDLAGMWVNDVLAPGATDAFSIRGGSFSARALGTVEVGAGAAIDVSGGGWLKGSPQKPSRSSGDAGSIRLQAASPAVNPNALVGAPEENPLRVAGDLFGFALGEAKGGKLTLGTSRVVIGATAGDDALGVTPGFFTRGGFADYSIVAPNGIEIAPGTTIAPRRYSWLLDGREANQPSGHLRDFAQMTLLTPDLRQATHLALTADNVFAGTVELGRDSRIDADIGATVKVVAGHQLAVGGAISAPGGTIDLAIENATTGKPTEDPFGSNTDLAGFLPDQTIWLQQGAMLNAAGAAKITLDANGDRKGVLFDGGTISLRATKGYVVAEQGSTIDVSGSSMEIDLRQIEGNDAVRSVPVTLFGDGGTISISAREGAFVDAALKAAGGGGSARGGRFELKLDRDNVFNAGVVDAFPYPNVDRRIVVTEDARGVPWNYRPGSDIPFSLFGTAPVSSAKLRESGADEIALTSDSRIVFSGDVTLSARRSITLDAPVISVASEPFLFLPGSTGGGDARVAAPYVTIGNRNTLPRYQTSRQASGGAGRFTAEADLLDLVGNLALQDIGRTRLVGRSDLRLSGVVTQDKDLVADGSLRVAGTLDIQAGQLYPTTLTQFGISAAPWSATGSANAVAAQAAGGAGAAESGMSLVRFARFGTPGSLPLSAGGKLEVTADRIEQGGVIRAPLGTIVLKANDSLDVQGGSETSVTATGLTIPFGRTENGLNWVYDIATGKPVQIEAPPEKRILLESETVAVAKGATIDLGGGGDLYGYEFVAGLGGSKDVLAATGTFAVMPGYSPAFAPFDPQYSTGYAGLKAGDQVTLSGGAGLPAGTYTLLPAHYALLPGAYAVTPVSGYQDLLPGRAPARKDGAAVVSGHLAVASLGQREARSQGFLVEPKATIRKRSEYRDEYANDFFVEDAERNDSVAPRLPQDGGRLQFVAQVSRDLVGQILMSAAGSAKDALGGQLDINAPGIFVSETARIAGGMMVLKPGMLSGLGAQSILLGGLRGEMVDGKQAIEVGADRVIVAGGGPELRAGEVLLVARDDIVVGGGAVIRSATADSDVGKAADTYAVSGDAAVLRVAQGGQANIERSGFARESGSILIGSGAALSGDAVLLDASKDIDTQGALSLGAGAVGIAAGRMAFGDVPAGTDGLVVGQPLLGQLRQAKELSFKSYSDLAFFGDVALGSALLEKLTIDAPALAGFGAGTTTLAAGTVVLQNSSGSAGNSLPRRNDATLVVSGRRRSGDSDSGDVVIGTGDLTIAGYGSTTLNADRTLTTEGDGSARFSGNLAMDAGMVSAGTGTRHSILAAGTVEISRRTGATVQKPAGFGAALEIAGANIVQDGTIDLPSGVLTLSSTGSGAGDGITLGAGSVTRATGYTKVFQANTPYEEVATADAGSIHLIAGLDGSGEATHDIRIESGATVDVSGAPAGGNAGTLDIVAPSGAVTIAGTIAGGAESKFEGGRLLIDAGSVGSLASIAGAATKGRFTGAFDLRARAGDLVLGEGDTIRAGSVSMSADAGDIDIAGRIDASGAASGRIRLLAGGDLTLRGTGEGGRGGRLSASAFGGGEDGGSILLGSSDGEVNLEAGSTIALAGGSKGRGGSLIVRAAQIAGQGDVRIAHLESTVTGAREQVIEAVRVYDGIESIAAGGSAGAVLGTDTVQADADAFMGNRDTILGRLGATSGFILRPGVEVRAAGDLSLDSPWNLAALRPGGEAGYLSLRAAGNLLLRNTLNDGFAAEVRAAEDPNGSGLILPSQLLDDASWSYRLAGGADLAAADPVRTVPAAGASGSGDVVVGAQAMVRTGTGSIEIAAGRDLRLESDFAGSGESAVIYTAGRPSASLASFIDFLSPELGGYPGLSNYAHDGGSIGIRAGRDVIGAATPYLVSNWLWRFGSTALDPRTGEYPFFGQPAWYPRPDLFRQNIGALAGGSVTVNAGHDVRDLSVMIPSTGRMNSAKPDASKLVVEGGGDIRVDAGGDIAGGQYLSSRGEVRLSAAGGLVEGNSWNGTAPPAAAIILLSDASASVSARESVTIENVIDPFVLPMSIENEGLAGGQMSWFSPSANSRLGVGALSGDLVLRNAVEAIQNAASGALFDPIGNVAPELPLSTHPATVEATAFSGNLSLPRGLLLIPSSSGNLVLLAQKAISLGGTVQMPDFDSSQLPSATLPGPLLSGNSFITELYGGTPYVAKEHATTPLHLDDRSPVSIMTETGDISSTVPYSVVLPKAVRVVAGRDVANVHLAGQNVADSDTSSVVAGRDIVFDETRTPAGVIDTNVRAIEVGGPGRLEISAGRNITLGNSAGIVTRGNLGNPALTDEGASIAVTVGAAATLDASKFAKQWLDAGKSVNYLAQLAEFMRAESGATSLTQAQAKVAFSSLDNDDQVRFARSVLRLEFAKAYLQPKGAPGVKTSYRAEWLKFAAAQGGNPDAPDAELLDSFATIVLWNELKATGRDAQPDGATPGVYSRGYDALALLGYADPFSYSGNLSLFLSQIKTQRGGSIDIFAPGGLVNGGATNLPAGFNKGSGDLGIITERGGSIRALVQNDFLVNSSRVFTLGGGDILIWSSKGNIDAGRGSRTAISAPPPVIRLVDGQFVVEYPGAAQGSGIGVLLTQPGTVPGDVDLIAPVGEVNAGDAGIRSAGRINIAAQRVVGADVIQAGGGVSGVPALAPPAPPAPPPPPAADKGAGGEESARALGGTSDKQKSVSSILTVEVLGVGGEEEDEEEKKRKRPAQ